MEGKIMTNDETKILFLTVEEAANLLKVKSSTLRTWIRRDDISSDLYIKFGGTIRFYYEKLKALAS